MAQNPSSSVQKNSCNKGRSLAYVLLLVLKLVTHGVLLYSVKYYVLVPYLTSKEHETHTATLSLAIASASLGHILVAILILMR